MEMAGLDFESNRSGPPLPGGPKLSRVKPPTFSRQNHTYFPAKKKQRIY